jgi:hypothetical protein
MNSPAIGIGYSMWLHLRWVAVGMVVYLLALAAAVQIAPSPMYFGLFGTLALSSVIAHVLTALTLGPADLGIRGTGYPKCMMVRPLRTRSLVGWPMFYGATTIALIWFFVSACILRPAGLNTPVLWPAALGAAGTAWLQAVGWSPFPSPFARIPALVLAGVPLILFGSCAGLFMESNSVSLAIAAGSLVWTFAAYAFAVNGLSRARAGSEEQWLFDFIERHIARLRDRFVSRSEVLPRFRSPFTAHLWYECRRNALALPMMFALAAVPMTFVLLRSVIDADSRDLYIFNATQITPSLLGLILMVAGLIMFCGLYGPGMAKFDVWGKEPMPAFFAIRPVTTPQYVAMKMTAAAISALITYGMVLVLAALWAIVEASSWNPRESVVRAVWASATPRTMAIAGLAPVALYTLACREMLTSMWSAFFGRKWFSLALGFTMMILLATGGALGWWIYRHAEWKQAFIDWLPWIVGLVLVVRLGAAAWILRTTSRLQLVPSHTIGAWLGAWLAGCVILFLVLCCFFTPSLTILAATLFLVPFARLAAAPLALHYNRRR